MAKIQVPKFDNDTKFVGYEIVEVETNGNKIQLSEQMRIINKLPGIPCGYCPALETILDNKNPVEITRFYDIRQRNVKKLKGYYISVVEEQQEYLCKCNNCNTIMFDENPQTDAVKHSITRSESHMVQVNDGTEEEPNWFWACPNCLTDSHLSDEIE